VWIKAEVVYQSTSTEEKEIRIKVSGYDQHLNFTEDFCWITRDMLKEVMESATEKA